MSSLYQLAEQMLVQWRGEDASDRRDPRRVGKDIVDTILADIRQHGFPAIDKAASHDRSRRNVAA